MNITKVGVGLAVLRRNGNTTEVQVLLGKRKGSHGKGEWSFPWGHMDHLESFVDVAYRELAEEVGENFKVYHPTVVSIINLAEYTPKHYIDIGMVAWYKSGDPITMEPDKCDGWQWFNITDLPTPRFATIDRILASWKMGHTNGVAIVWDKE